MTNQSVIKARATYPTKSQRGLAGVIYGDTLTYADYRTRSAIYADIRRYDAQQKAVTPVRRGRKLRPLVGAMMS